MSQQPRFRQRAAQDTGAVVLSFPAGRRAMDNGLSNAHDELADFLAVLESSTTIRRHLELLQWLQGSPLQRFLPHRTLILAWGNFAEGPIHFDVVSPSAAVRTRRLLDEGREAMHSLLRQIHAEWLEGQRRPRAHRTARSLLEQHMTGTVLDVRDQREGMECLLVHAIHDARERHDCLCVALGDADLGGPMARDALELLLPHIDMAQRRVSQLAIRCGKALPSDRESRQQHPGEEEASSPSSLTARELEILHWVGKGKTNIEIGLILNISGFTVKNHLQRIFKKLDVLNRAQAIARSRRLIAAA